MEVVALDDLSGSSREGIPEGVRWIQATVTDYEFLTRLFEEEKFDYVYHLAAEFGRLNGEEY